MQLCPARYGPLPQVSSASVMTTIRATSRRIVTELRVPLRRVLTTGNNEVYGNYLSTPQKRGRRRVVFDLAFEVHGYGRVSGWLEQPILAAVCVRQLMELTSGCERGDIVRQIKARREEDAEEDRCWKSFLSGIVFDALWYSRMGQMQMSICWNFDSRKYVLRQSVTERMMHQYLT